MVRNLVRWVVVGLVLAMLPLPLLANDSDASVALGGVQLTREPRISMESERLTISLSKITVEYEFLNESDQDITTEVAFPIPPYENTERAAGIRDFDDFKLWVDGKEVKYEVEAKAFLVKTDDHGNKVGKDNDVSAILHRNNIDIPTLGHYTETHDEKTPDFERLSPEIKKQLSDLGLVDAENGDSRPEWEVRKTYYWKQTFPAHKILHVRHEYSPGFGFGGMQVGIFDKSSLEKLIAEDKRFNPNSNSEEQSHLLSDTCVPSSLQKKIFQDDSAIWRADPDNGGYIESFWVDYILTTANSWKTPIKKFELVVERGQNQRWYDPNWDYASFCWDGPVKQAGAYRYEASATDFIPKRELKVLFLTMPVADATSDGTGVSHRSTSRRLYLRLLWVGLLLAVVVLVVIWWVRRSRGIHSSR